MKKATLKSIVTNLIKGFFVLLIVPMGQVLGQETSEVLETGETVTIEMDNGEEYSGELIYVGENEVRIKTSNSEITLIASKVKEIKKGDYEFSKFRFENPNKTRYFFAPTAIPLEKGEGYYQNVMLSSNFVNFGITKNISVGGGIEFISTVLGEPLWFLNPKIGFPIAEKLHLGGGVFLAGLAGEGVRGMGYGMFTYGDSDASVSFGMGKGSGEGFSTVASGSVRVSNNIAILSENYFLPSSLEGFEQNQYLGIHGVRILSKKNSFDVGALIVGSLVEFLPALPYIGYTRHF